MYEQLTNRARKVVALSRDEAHLLNHNYISTEHLLLGLIREGEGAAAKTLESFGISLDLARDQVRQIVGQGEKSPTGDLPFRRPARRVLELSQREAFELNHNYISTEHLLLGLIREGEGVAVQALTELDVDLDLDQIRQRAMQFMRGTA